MHIPRVTDMIRNHMETIVEEMMRTLLRDNANRYAMVCGCSSCMAYAQATALNLLPPFYITGVAGEVYGEYHEAKNRLTLQTAIAKGLEQLIQEDPNGHNQTP